jgi:hypothetical protein
VDAHFNLGVLFHTIEREDLAVAPYTRAIELEPKHYDAMSNLGSVKHKVCIHSVCVCVCVCVYTRATELEPKHYDAMSIHSMCALCVCIYIYIYIYIYTYIHACD